MRADSVRVMLAAICVPGLAAAGEVPVALYRTHLAVRIVDGLRVTGGVECGAFRCGEAQVSCAQGGLELPDRAGTEDCRCHPWPVGHPRQRHLGHRDTAF